MTMASQGALELDSVLQKRASKGLKGLAGVYHRRLKRVGLSAWLLATSEVLVGCNHGRRARFTYACFVPVP